MKKNKTKENILSVITLCGIFGLFAYFQFAESPVKHERGKYTNTTEIKDATTSENETYDNKTSEKKDVTTNTNEGYNFEIVETKGKETPDVITISLIDENEISNDGKLNNITKSNEIEPTKYQLDKAKMYIDRVWASDENCKQEWIDYLQNNPNALDKYNDQNNTTANDEKKHAELTKVSSND